MFAHLFSGDMSNSTFIIEWDEGLVNRIFGGKAEIVEFPKISRPDFTGFFVSFRLYLKVDCGYYFAAMKEKRFMWG